MSPTTAIWLLLAFFSLGVGVGYMWGEFNGMRDGAE